MRFGVEEVNVLGTMLSQRAVDVQGLACKTSWRFGMVQPVWALQLTGPA